VAWLLWASAIKLIRRATMPFRGPSQGFSSSSQARERRDCQRITAGRDMPGAAKLGFIDAVGVCWREIARVRFGRVADRPGCGRCSSRRSAEAQLLRKNRGLLRFRTLVQQALSAPADREQALSLYNMRDQVASWEPRILV
jgi:hypothetical protein